MSTKKKVHAGDTLTVGDLTDDYLGAEIELGPMEGIRTRMDLDRIEEAYANVLRLFTTEGGYRAARGSRPVTVITPPPVVQPDEPKTLGQCIRIEGDDGWLGIVADTQGGGCRIWDTAGYWFHWDSVLSRAGDRQIIVSDPPRWPDEAPAVPERADAWALPRAGDTFNRIEDMPYGWIAKVTLENGDSWGHVVRYGEGRMTHLWDVNYRHGVADTALWEECGEGTRSGGDDGDTTYTLVEPSKAYDERVYLGEVPERIEAGKWPDDDTHLREWEWIGHLDYRWRWYAEETRKSGWAWTPDAVRRHNPIRGPWTRGERLTETQEDAS